MGAKADKITKTLKLSGLIGIRDSVAAIDAIGKQSTIKKDRREREKLLSSCRSQIELAYILKKDANQHPAMQC